MRDKNFLTAIMGIFVVGVFAFSIMYNGFDFKLTGHAVFGNDEQAEFDLGTYANTEWNGSAVVLSGTNMAGNYTSVIFDAGSDAVWNNISWTGNEVGELLNNKEGSLMNGNVLLMHMNEASGVVEDTSGENNDGTYNGVLYSQSGKLNTAIGFDGSDDYVNVSDSGSLSLVGDITLEAWIKPNSVAGYKNIIVKEAGVNQVSYGLTTSPSDIYFWFYADSAYQIHETTSDFLNTGQWWHIVAVYDDVNNNVTLYANGVEKYNAVETSSLVDYANSPLNIGWRNRKIANHQFNGTIDEIAIWNRSLSADEISEIYKRGILRLNLTARTCDDNTCSGESFSDISDISPQDLSLINNQYFQYKFLFETDDSSYSPELQSVSVDYTILNTAPIISLALPQNGANYGYNESLALDFSVSDDDDNLGSCWYSLNGGDNVALPACANTTFDIAEGSNTLSIYVNDTAGLEANSSVNFNVAVGAPSIVLNSPIEVYLSSGQNIEFSYTPTDIDLASCWLLGDFGGSFQKNQTDNSPTSANVNSFLLNLDDGEYLWNIGCNDSEGNSASNGNKTFYIDTVNPAISLTEPTGTKKSRTGISLSFDVFDNSPLSCYYNITTSVGTSVVDNIEIADCNNASFDVSSDGDYILYLWTTDFAGNSESLNSSFSVDTSTSTPAVPVPTDGGGSSGGGGGSIIVSRTSALAKLEIEKVDVVASKGEDKNLLVNVKNVGGVSANKCNLVAEEGYEKYIDSIDLFNIGVGEIVEFMFVLAVLDENVEELDLSVKCLENVSAKVPIEIIVWQPDLDVSIIEISFKSEDELLIAYNIEPTDSSTHSLLFRILNSDSGIVAEVSENIELIFGQLYSGEILIDIFNVDEGILKIAITDENEVNFIEESFVYSGSSSITGFSLVNMDGESSYVGIILVLFLIVAGFLVVRIWKLYKKK